MVEKTVRYIGYSADFGARMRLLSEELIRSIRFVLEETFASLWVETNDENMEMRMRGGMPRAMAVRDVVKKYGVNRLGCICAIDRATLTTLMDYWVPGVSVMGVHELLGNALVMKGEKERTTDLRGDDIGGE